ncbi:MAG: intradiol ring-cleavage dioxygenase [Bacteroidia bacterium]
MKFLLFLYTAALLAGCQSRQRPESTPLRQVGGPCEGCEALFECGNRALNMVDTLPGFFENEPRITLEGTVYQPDGKTPAEGVIIYIYHTNRDGIYPTRGGEQDWGRRHGYIRGWAKTGKDGRYAFFSFRPGAYPGRNIPEHIHITVKEPDTVPYYLEDFFFDDDPLLSASQRASLRGRGGSGIVKLEAEGGLLHAKRDLVLGRNVEGY